MKTYLLLLSTACLPLVPGMSRGDETNDAPDFFGITVTQTETKAEKQFRLGSNYYHGKGVEQDAAKAVDCFRKAAESGHAEAQHNLGTCYLDGTGLARSETEAAKWFEKAAKQGLQESYYPLGICYYNLEQYVEAYAWALAAASHGDTRLREMLDSMYTEEEITAGKARFEVLQSELKQEE
jgi:TPR repeat protein